MIAMKFMFLKLLFDCLMQLLVDDFLISDSLFIAA